MVVCDIKEGTSRHYGFGHDSPFKVAFNMPPEPCNVGVVVEGCGVGATFVYGRVKVGVLFPLTLFCCLLWYRVSSFLSDFALVLFWWASSSSYRGGRSFFIRPCGRR